MSEESPEAPASASSDPPTRAPKLGRQLLLATLFGVFVVAALSIYGDGRALLDHLQSYDWMYFVYGLALATANYAVRFVRWQYYLHRLDIRGVPTLESARIFTAGFVMSVTPGKVGEVFKSVLLHESRGISIARTAPIVVAERLTDLLALVFLAAIGSLVLAEGGWVALGGGLLVGGVWLVCAWRPLGEWALRIAAKLPAIGRIVPKLREAYDSLRVLVAPAPFAIATAMSVVSWFLECISLWLIAQGFVEGGNELDWLEATFAYSVPTIAGAVAMMPGGLGVTEAGMTGVLERLAGMSLPVATATTLLVRFATLWWAVLLGVFALIWHRRAMRARGPAPTEHAPKVPPSPNA